MLAMAVAPTLHWQYLVNAPSSEMQRFGLWGFGLWEAQLYICWIARCKKPNACYRHLPSLVLWPCESSGQSEMEVFCLNLHFLVDVSCFNFISLQFVQIKCQSTPAPAGPACHVHALTCMQSTVSEVWEIAAAYTGIQHPLQFLVQASGGCLSDVDAGSSVNSDLEKLQAAQI